MPSDLLVHLLVPRHGGGMLVAHGPDGPALPSIIPEIGADDRLVAAVQRHLRDRWNLDPLVLETHLPPPPSPDDGYIGLAVLEAPAAAWRPPPGMRWASSPPLLPQRVARRARTWLAEWEADASPPELRPPWSRPGWTARASAWIDDALHQAGRTRTGPATLVRLWSISAMLRIPTDAGDAWFKAVFPHFHHEPAVTALLASAVPDALPSVLGIAPGEGWLLMEAAGSPVPRSAASDVDILRAIDRLADVQQLLRARLDGFVTLGCPRRPLSTLPDDLAAAIDEAPGLGGPAVAAEEAAQVVDRVAERAASIDGLDFADVLVHGDFHPGNLLVDGPGTRILDWSDAAVGNPVVEIGPWFGEVRPELRRRGWDAWLRALSRFGPAEALRAHEDDAYAVACAYQVVSYAGILRGIEPENRYQLSDGFNGYWNDLVAGVAPVLRS